MTRGAYRDHLEGLRSRVEERLARTRELEARVDLPSLARIDPAEHQRLAALARTTSALDLRPHGPLGAPNEAALERAEADVVRYEAALHALVGRAPDLELIANTPFGEPPDPPIPANSIETSGGSFYGALLDELHELGDTLRKALGHVSGFEYTWVERPHATMFAGRAALRARFISGSTPMKLLVEASADTAVPLYRTTLVTTIAPAVPPLLVEPRGNTPSRIWSFLRRRSDGFGPRQPTGDPELDERYTVRSPEAPIPLTRIVRSRLLELARFDVPTLRCGTGLATLQYIYDPEPPVLRAALDLLSRLHATQIPISILKGG